MGRAMRPNQKSLPLILAITSTMLWAWPFWARADDSQPTIDLFDATFDNSSITDYTRTPQEDLEFLIGTLHLNRILSHDLYLQCAPLNDRDIATFAGLLDWTSQTNTSRVSLFFNVCPNMFCSCQDILSYLAIGDPELLHDLYLEILQTQGLNIPATLNLFQNARVEQRRAGIMFEFQKRLWHANLGFQVPLYYLERNYNMPEQDIEAIKSADISEHNDTEKSQEKAYHKKAVDDRVGVGNLHCSFAWHALDIDRCTCNMGVKVTLPTAFAFKTGMLGSNFAKKAHAGSIDLEKVTAQIRGTSESGKSQAVQSLTDYAEDAINWMGSALLATDLGREKRFEIGLFFEPTLYLHDRLWLQASARTSWLTPRCVRRLVKEVIDQATLTNSFFEPYDVGTTEKFLVLQNRLNQVVFPPRYRTRAHWQFEGQFTLVGTFVINDNWACTLGYDYWHRNADKLTNFVFCQGHKSTHNMRYDCAKRGEASHNSILAQIQYSQIRYTKDFVMKIGADLPISASGMGTYYTGFVRCEWNF